jgi:hypothetical protein
VRFWTDWTGFERSIFVVLAVLALPLLLSSPSQLGIGPSFLVLLATIGVWLWFNRWLRSRHPVPDPGSSPSQGEDASSG